MSASPYSRENYSHRNNQHLYKDRQRHAAAKAEVGETHIENQHYARLMTDWIRCTGLFIDGLKYPQVL